MTMFEDFKARVGLPVSNPVLNEAIHAIDKTTDVFYLFEACVKANAVLT